MSVPNARQPGREGPGKPPRRPSIRDVAALAGVSVGTVSHVLNRPERVAPATRARIERTMERLGFVPNGSARHLRMGTSLMIGVQVLDIANPFWGEVVRGVEAAVDDARYAIVTSSSGESAEKEARNVELLRRHRVDGLLIAPVASDESPLEELEAGGVPVVLLDHRSSSGQLSFVAVDDVYGGRVAAEHLLRRGHRRLALVNGPLSIAWCADRRAGVLDAVRRSGLDPGAVVSEVSVAALNTREGEAAAAALAELTPAPTAIVCANDLLALGVLRGLAERGRSVPDDIALVGYDDVEFSAVLSPPLTTVRQEPYQLGLTAGQLLLRRLNGADDGTPREVLFRPRLIVRASG